MSQAHLPPAPYIDTPAALESLLRDLRAAPLVAIDTESNSLHAYQERVCLIQISTRQQDYILDPLALDGLSGLGEVLADPGIEKVFHAADYDLACLQRDYGFTVVNLFDTMMAARVAGYKAFGLGHLLKTHFGVSPDKKHQRDNWGRRPLPKDSLRYAQMDTHFLPRLRDILHEELTAMGRLEEALEVFSEEAALDREAPGRGFDPGGFWKLALPNKLTPEQAGVLRELFALRDDVARELDRPPFKVFANNALVEIARRAPVSKGDLQRISGLNANHVRRYGSAILQAVTRGQDSPAHAPPRHRPPHSIISERYIALHTWRKERAIQRGVESDVILPKQALWALAERAPTHIDELAAIQGFGPWKRAHYGQEVLALLADFTESVGDHVSGED